MGPWATEEIPVSKQTNQPNKAQAYLRYRKYSLSKCFQKRLEQFIPPHIEESKHYFIGE